MSISFPARLTSERNLSSFLFALAILYAFFGLAFESGGRVVLILLCLILFITCATYNRKAFKQPVLLFIPIAIFIGMTTWLLTNLQVPDIAAQSPRLGGILDKLSFIPLAFVLANAKNRIYLFWGAAICAALAMPWLKGSGLSEIMQALNGRRSGLGGHIITMGIIYTIIAFSCLVFFNRFCLNNNQLWRWPIWLALLAASFFGIIASQTRAIYLGIALIYTLFFILIITWSIRDWKRNKANATYFITISLVLLVITLTLQHYNYFDALIKKVNSEQSVLWLLITGNIQDIPRNSSGLRIYFWVDAYNWILERPWTGWGESANKHLHAAAGNYFGQRIFHSIHNDIFEITLSHGLLGLGFYCVLTTWLYRKVLNAWKDQRIKNDSFIFFNIFIIFFIFNGQFMSLFYFHETIYLWNIIMASYLAKIINYGQIQEVK